MPWRSARWKRRQRELTIHAWQDFPAAQFQGASLAIVGNAGYLSELVQGEQIDRHNLVLRMNNFRLAGFEASVGRRADIFLTNFFTDIDFENPVARAARFVVASIPNNDLKRRGIRHRGVEHITRGMEQLGRREVYVPDSNWFAELVATLGKYPTTGAMAILFALEFLAAGGAQVYVTGFSFFEGQGHYFRSGQVVPVNHNIDGEKEFVRNCLQDAIQGGQVSLDPVMQRHLYQGAGSRDAAA
jgi:hypothetical protein